MNLLILMSDEHRRDALGCMGHGVVQTPHLDALAAAGTVFTNAYSPSPMCVPARAALACGDYVHRIGCWDSAQPYRGSPPGWMHRLRAQGAEMMSFGKLHFRGGDDDNGFSEEVLPMHVHGGIGWPLGLLRRPPPAFPQARELAAGVGRGDSDYSNYDRAVTAAAEHWLEQRRGNHRPWAACVHFVSPHYPLCAPADFYDLYDPEQLELYGAAPGMGAMHPEMARLRRFFNYDDYFDPPTRHRALAAYYGLCSFLDDCAGRVLRALEASGQRDRTLVLYTSDHGEMLGEQGFWTKQVLYEAAAGVPLIVSGPGIPAGRRQATPASLLDIHPTTLETFGLSPDPDRPGQSLQGLAREDENPDRTVFSEYHDGGSTTGAFMIRWQHWKYIYYVGEAPQLFDLAADPRELQDRAQDPRYAETLAEADRRLRSVCDPEAVNAQCFAAQARRIAELGGAGACLEGFNFNHTPVPELQKPGDCWNPP